MVSGLGERGSESDNRIEDSEPARLEWVGITEHSRCLDENNRDARRPGGSTLN